MAISELPSRSETVDLIEAEVRRLAVPGGFSPDLKFIKLEDLIRQEKAKGVDRAMEANMLRFMRLYGLTGDIYLFVREKGNGWPGQPIGMPIAVPRGSGDEFFCGVYIPGIGEKKKDSQKIMAVLAEAENVPLPPKMEKHFVDGFLVVTRDVVENWQKEKRVFFEPAQMNSPMHAPERLLERKKIADEMAAELVREQMAWALRAIGMLNVTRLRELAQDRKKPFRQGGAVNLSLRPYINTAYAHMKDWLGERDPECIFVGADVGDLHLDACERPLPMGSFDSIHPVARRMSTERSGANLHHILPRKGLILEMYNFIVRNNIPPDFDSRDLIMLLSYAEHREYLDMTNPENARLHKDMRVVDRNMAIYARLMETTINNPRNMGKVCEGCHYGIIHYDTEYQVSIAATLQDIENGRVKIRTDEGYSRGNVATVAERIVYERDRQTGMNSAKVFEWLQLSRLLTAESGHLYVQEQTANLMLRVAASRTDKLSDDHTHNQVVLAANRANGRMRPDLGGDMLRALESTPYPVPVRRPKNGSTAKAA